MSHCTGRRSRESSMLEKTTIKSLLLPNMSFSWPGPGTFAGGNLPITPPHLQEQIPYQQHCDPFGIPFSSHQEELRLCRNETNPVPPPTYFTKSANICSQTPNFCTSTQLPSLPFSQQYPPNDNMFFPLQPHVLENQQPLSEIFTSTLLQSEGLPTYQLDGNALQNPLQIPQRISVDDTNPHLVMDAVLRSTAEQVDLQAEPVQMNQIIVCNGNLNRNEIIGEKQEVGKFSSLFEELSGRHRSVEVANKPRIRWTTELHESFIQAVNDLGGPDKATPRSILIRMDTDGLTIVHVKSHLQKYRLPRYQPESKDDKGPSCLEGKKRNISEKENKASKLPIEDVGTLHTQWELQRVLHDQLKVIRKLQLQTEENGRRLQEFMESQNKMREAFMQATQSCPSTSMVNNTNGASAQACTSDKDEALPNHDHAQEDCFIVESNVELPLQSHKRSRPDIESNGIVISDDQL